MIDPLNIFQEIKSICNENFPNASVFAFGSRVSGKSTSKKWDFDVLIYTNSRLKDLKENIKNHFNGRLDENGKEIKVDVFNTRYSTIEELKKYLPNAVLL